MIPNSKQRRILGHHLLCSNYNADPISCRVCTNLWDIAGLPDDLDQLREIYKLPQKFFDAMDYEEGEGL